MLETGRNDTTYASFVDRRIPIFARHCIDIEDEKKIDILETLFFVLETKKAQKIGVKYQQSVFYQQKPFLYSWLQTKTVHFTDRLNIKYWLPGIKILVSGTRQPVKVFYR